ncbi:S-methyl-5-thioribose kinase [Clostridium scatologenes]|uniref:S-methyl-5-thioribose kinase n=1 Tax=Clostridium scatologenes TaxID=1548 RepID=A0A0E3GPT7_CLOSL|nr:S-methyl-5-thioribose kinase [Clostridium scatologenes]AKA67391.1 5-methylthioribose kinase [Clostridium scatologenes]
MGKFTDEYFRMNEEDALQYAKSQLEFFDGDAEITCKEIGDGNLNYVFKIEDKKSNKSLIIKQAGPVARISDEFKVSPDRNRIESEILELQYKLSEGLVPKVYKYDSIMNCFAMEDLSDYEIMRTALNEHKKFPRFTDQITTFLVNTLLLTSDAVINHKKKKELVKDFINPELCEITEDLVYTEPFYDCSRNDLLPETKKFAISNLWNDKKLLLETAKLKFEFMTNAQSLIHGDLHTGSIFVKPNSTKVFDAEFAFYGPAGYDIGNVIANLIFAYENAEATILDKKEKEDYKCWLESSIVDIIDLFCKKFKALWKENVSEKVANYEGFLEYYLGNILKDTSAVVGLELARRIIGLAHVSDIVSIKDIEKRIRAEKICLLSSKKFILDRENIKSGGDFIKVIKDTENKF